MIRDIFSTAALLVMAAALALAAYWQWLDQLGPPLEVMSSATDRPAYHPGERMVITRHVCRTSAAPYVTHRAFVDGVVYALPDFPTVGFSLGCQDVSIDVTIPETLPPGRYVYRMSTDFRINPLRTWRVDLPDIPVIVLPPLSSG